MNKSFSKKKIITAIVILTLATIIVVAGAVFITTVIKKSLYQTVYDAKKDVLQDSVENTKIHIDNMRTQIRAEHPDYSEEKIKDEVIVWLRDFIYKMNYTDDSYIWVQEVFDYDGGDKYAIRLIHPNLKDTEGTMLSTFATDSKGNHPYEEELEGIKREGHIFLYYSFKELYSDMDTMKLTYSSLYPDYNWIVSRGVPLNKLDNSVKKIQEYESPLILAIVIIYAIAVLTILIYAIILKKKANELEEVRKSLSKEVDLSHKANKARARFLFEVSNDISSSVSEVTRNIDLAVNSIDDERELFGYLNGAKNSGIFLESLISDARKMLFMDKEDIDITESVMDIRDNAKSIRKVIPGLIKDKDIRIVIDEKDITHYIVYADEIRLRQITMTLLSGAVRYSKPGGIVSCILSEITSDKEGYARYRLVVEDKGVGIPEEIKEHMFDLLEEGNAKLDVNDNSTRYSMSIVKRILDSMDGTIKIDSKIGKGTRVTIEIPLRIAEVK